MDQKEFTERVARLQKVSEVIDKLPSEIRNGAFDLLKDYISGTRTVPTSESKLQEAHGDLADTNLFTLFDHAKPSDNVRLIAASLYKEYGSEPFSVDEVKAIADDAGITLPDRVDKTLVAAQENEKHLFAKAGRGKFKPTVHGEVYLKATYSVKKGTKKRGPEAAEAP